MKTWIGDQENLRDGDVITGWSRAITGGITFQVQRFDSETARAVLEYLQPVIPAVWAQYAATRFGVERLYLADPEATVTE